MARKPDLEEPPRGKRHDHDETVAQGQRLREARERIGLSVRKTAELLGAASHSTIRDIEIGRTRVPAKRLEQLAEIYQVKLLDLRKPPRSPWSEPKRHAAPAADRSLKVRRMDGVDYDLQLNLPLPPLEKPGFLQGSFIMRLHGPLARKHLPH